VQLATDGKFGKRTKHFEVKVHAVREWQSAGEISVVHVLRDQQPADMMVKPNTVVDLERFIHRVMGSSDGQNHFKADSAHVCFISIEATSDANINMKHMECSRTPMFHYHEMNLCWIDSCAVDGTNRL
jgi:hypothetical protein